MIEKQPEKVLIVKLGSIGDVVNTLPLVNVVKDSWPETKLGWLIEPKSHPLVEGHSSVDRFIVFRRDRGLSGVYRARREIRAYRPDLVIDLQRILRSSFFTFFSGCSQRLGFDRRRSKECSWLFTNLKIPSADPGCHMVRQYLEFARYLGLKWSEVEFKLPVTEKDIEAARKLLPAGALEEGFLVLNPGAAKPFNRWPVPCWIQLARFLLDRFPHYLVMSGGPQDARRNAMIIQPLGSETRMVNLAGRTSLKQLGGVFSLARLAVSGDTGPLHIASALNTPTIGLFGPANPRRTGPFNHRGLVVSVPPHPAPGREENRPWLDWMGEISPERVMNRIISVINS